MVLPPRQPLYKQNSHAAKLAYTLAQQGSQVTKNVGKPQHRCFTASHQTHQVHVGHDPGGGFTLTSGAMGCSRSPRTSGASSLSRKGWHTHPSKEEERRAEQLFSPWGKRQPRTGALPSVHNKSCQKLKINKLKNKNVTLPSMGENGAQPEMLTLLIVLHNGMGSLRNLKQYVCHLYDLAIPLCKNR